MIGESGIASVAADGSGGGRSLGLGSQPAISPDGRYVLLSSDDRGLRRLEYSELAADGTLSPPRKFFGEGPQPDVWAFALSPDGKLLAYIERGASGERYLYLTKFPSGEGKWQVSSNASSVLRWSRATSELLFVTREDQGPWRLTAVKVAQNPGVTVGSGTALFDFADPSTRGYAGGFDVTPDGASVVKVRSTPSPGSGSGTHWVLIQNWLRASKERQ